MKIEVLFFFLKYFKGRGPKYNDFFDQPIEETEDELLSKDMDKKEARTQNETKSTFEERQERLKKKIHTIEDELIADKSWQMKGEITGIVRPENTLLEEDVTFEHLTRQGF